MPSETKSPERCELLRIALETLDRAGECLEQIARDGLTVKTLGSGNTHRHPLLQVQKDSVAQFSRLWTRFALEASPCLDKASLDRIELVGDAKAIAQFTVGEQPIDDDEDDEYEDEDQDDDPWSRQGEAGKGVTA